MKNFEKIMTETGASPLETAAVGDSIGDLEMFMEAGLAIAINPSVKDLAVLRANVPRLVTVKGLEEAAVILENHFDRGRAVSL
ncbi:HAD hydrolase family protein [Desulfallas sp. Bu1-1]|jgi:phosphoserine phosphatase|uniref:HAD hydrolase family protein n=1 Tax=Desulfallas sp. Bu1-1 TaxID=2787620 RepID=UPI00189FA54F|nr:HAD hydrolase family protein [Desulfallas sp. Bu1-1]MBF7082444.1 HAD hydrolase family protein [Desulfallas sp. Bu1-1]